MQQGGRTGVQVAMAAAATKEQVAQATCKTRTCYVRFELTK